MTGDFATRGPPPPEPPQMVSESSGDYPSMVDDLDAGETEGRTKMSFAKMQTPVELRESYVFDDHDFDVQNDDELEVCSSGENSNVIADGNHDIESEDGMRSHPDNETNYQDEKFDDHSPMRKSPKALAPAKSPKAASSPTNKKHSITQKVSIEDKAAQLGLYS